MITHVIWDLGDTLITPPRGGRDLEPLNEYPEIQLRPDAEETLRTLADNGYVQAVLSNTGATDSDGATRLLGRFGIAKYFRFIYATQSELTHDKPEKPSFEAFAIVLSALDVRAEQTVMIGNSWDHDVVGANRSGLHAIWLTNPSVSVRRFSSSQIESPPWILPVWDVAGVPQALEVLRDAIR